MSVKRILVVTAGLAATGAVVGSVLGALTMLGVMLVASRGMAGGGWQIAGEVLGIAALFGAGIGTVLAPIFAWALLRTVPLGRAILGTALGTLTGAIVGPLIYSPLLIPGAIGGFILAAVALRVTASRARTRRIAEESAV